jgi:hypothetical protein
MDNKRYREIENSDTAELTAEEKAQGWHFCPDWDFMLVNSNDKEGEGAACTCKD